MTRAKRTYYLPTRTLEAVRELANRYGVAPTQDAVVELAVEELARRVQDEEEASRWAEASRDPAFIAEVEDIERAHATADAETWPRE